MYSFLTALLADISAIGQGSQSQKSELGELTELHTRIQSLPNDPKYYVDPNHIVQLPFPSANPVPVPFSVSNTGLIPYMGRECFDQVWDAFLQILSDPRHHQAIYIYGSKGFGKSHIILALACLLIRQGHRVVYIPDCHAMLRTPFRYLQRALLFAFTGSEASIHHLEEIYNCQTVEALADYCTQYRYTGQLCFVVDQFDALDLEPKAQGGVAYQIQVWVRELLQRMSAEHIEVISASANDKTFLQMARRDTGAPKIHLLGGMTASEMSCWWNRYDFTALSHADKQRIEDLTGCIPLLLDPFVTHLGKPLESLEPLIWEEEALASVRREIFEFAQLRKTESKHGSFHVQFVPLMGDCLMHTRSAGSGVIMDHRYFYLDSDDRGRYSCGLAREAITEFLREHGENGVFLRTGWLSTLLCYKDNPSAIGFTVERILLSRIASTGVHLGNFNIPAATIVTFEGGTPRLFKDEELAYYVPLKFNQKTIDALFVSLDQKKNTAHVVAIQITVAKPLKDAESAFFADLDAWLHGLSGYQLKMTFLWIYHGSRVEVEAKLTELRSRTVLRWPEHEVHWVSVEQVHESLANILTKIGR